MGPLPPSSGPGPVAGMIVGWRTAFGNMGKDEGDTVLGFYAGLDSHALELYFGKLRLQKIRGSPKKISRFRVAIIPNRD
jgi:hypothetical protein